MYFYRLTQKVLKKEFFNKSSKPSKKCCVRKQDYYPLDNRKLYRVTHVGRRASTEHAFKKNHLNSR